MQPGAVFDVAAEFFEGEVVAHNYKWDAHPGVGH